MPFQKGQYAEGDSRERDNQVLGTNFLRGAAAGITCITRTIDPSLRLAVFFQTAKNHKKMNTKKNIEETVKKIVLLLFGKRIRKTILKRRTDYSKWYNELVASPLSEWRDRLWQIRNLDGLYGNRSLRFLAGKDVIDAQDS